MIDRVKATLRTIHTYIMLAHDLLDLLLIAVVVFVAEELRFLWCKATRQQYKPPRYRIAEQSVVVDDD